MRRVLAKIGNLVLEIFAQIVAAAAFLALTGVFGLPVAFATVAVFLLGVGAIWWLNRRQKI